MANVEEKVENLLKQKIELPLLVINEGNYKFESIVCKVDDIYHISPEFEINF